ncbi:MAG: endonuclease/exonuclease/phosphatase family protein [Planctomycetes bacterium]|nr:endonuclease/exonuclease/phosphatase family protein [Planctomycetota bacterium]
MSDHPDGDVPRLRGWRLTVAWLALGPVAVIAIGSTAVLWWPGELLVHWTLHASLVLVPVVAVLARQRRWAGGLLLAMLVGAAPWVRAGYGQRAVPVPGEAAVRIAVATANLYDFNADRPAAFDGVFAQGGDLIGLAEVQPHLDRARLLADRRWPFQVLSGPPSILHVGLLSRYPLIDTRLHDLDGVGLIETTVVLDGGRRVAVLVAHPSSPTTPAAARRRNRQFGEIARLLAARQGAVLVLGDFNCTVAAPAWSGFLELTGLRRAAGTEPATWPSVLGRCGIGIDHILVRDAGVEGEQAFTIPGSDHRGLNAVVVVPTGALVPAR